MFNTLRYKGNANQNALRSHLTLIRMASSRKQATNADKKEPSYIVGGNVN
jgi:hypothetical protein